MPYRTVTGSYEVASRLGHSTAAIRAMADKAEFHVPAEHLRDVLGITHVNYIAGNHTLAVVDSTLGTATANGARFRTVAGSNEVKIDNFTFTPPELMVAVGTTVKFVNHDDIPHSVVDKNKAFRSKALDTDDSFTFTFVNAGSYDYFCGLHPHMTGKIIVK